MWRKIQKFLGTFVPTLLLILYFVVAICYLNRWDGMVPVTLTPVWAWSAAGMLVSLITWILCRGVYPGVLFTLFLFTAVAFSEETRGIVRELIVTLRKAPPAEPSPRLLRVVSVRCNGKESALRLAAESKPDILLIQEAPDKMILEAVADQLYGVERSVSHHHNAAVIARGETLAWMGDPKSSTLHVRIRRLDGFILDVTNLDLDGCAPHLQMWRPTAWNDLIRRRTETRRLVRQFLGENPINRAKVGRIVGGGFGTPPGDDVFRPLQTNGMVDTYAASGIGWGNTYPAEFPVLRLDQIWSSKNLLPVRSETIPNPDSRHRIVVSDVEIPAS